MSRILHCRPITEQLDVGRGVEYRPKGEHPRTTSRGFSAIADLQNYAFSSSFGTTRRCSNSGDERRELRGFSGIADLKNSAFSSNFGTNRRCSRSGV